MKQKGRYNNTLQTTLLLFLCFLTTQVFGQSTPFIMNTMGKLSGTNNSGLALNFKSNAACLDVQNGIAVLQGVRANGQFAMNCEVKMNFNTLGIKMYPNPVQANTNIKFINTPPLTQEFNLSIWNTEGFLVMTRKETGYTIFQGMTIDMSTLHAGVYVLKIESASFVDAIKFIKAN